MNARPPPLDRPPSWSAARIVPLLLAAVLGLLVSATAARAGGRLSILRDGQLAGELSSEEILRLDPGEFLDARGDAHRGPAIGTILAAAGVTSAAEVVVERVDGRGIRLAWPVVVDPIEDPRLAEGPGGTLRLIGHGPLLGEPRSWIEDVRLLDARSIASAAAPASPVTDPRPATATARAAPAAPTGGGSRGGGNGGGGNGGGGDGGGKRGTGASSTETLEVVAGGTRKTLRLDAIRAAAKATYERDGLKTPVTPLVNVLASAGVEKFTRIRAVGEEDTLALTTGAPPAPDPKDYGVAFNRRGLPILVPLPAPEGAPKPAGSGTRREVRRLVRIEVE